MSPAPASLDGKELVPLAHRLGALLGVRLALALIVLVAAATGPGTVGVHASALAPATALYVLGAVVVELLRRVTHVRGLPLVTGMLLVDGIYLGWVLARTGGPQSVLAFVVYVHVIAVTLLTSHRIGLKIALWHGLLLFLGYFARAADIVGSGGAGGAATRHAAALYAVAFWIVALATAGFSSLNERELRRGKAELRGLAAMARRLEEVNDPVQVMHAVVEHTLATTGFGRGLLVASEPGSGRWRGVAGGAVGDAATEVEDGTEPALLARCRAEQAPVLRARPGAEDGLLVRLLPGARNLVAAPLVADGETIGLLAVERGGGRDALVLRRVVDTVAQFAAHGALALRNAWLLAEVERLATTDGLTGLANRRTFDSVLRRELERAVRTGLPCTLVVLDVDHFKRVNDVHGHQAGDEVLRLVGAALGHACRSIDLPARYGGEEFVVVSPSCPPAEALALAERLRAAAAAAPTPVPVTLSAGVATYPFNANDPASLVAAADDALYRSKKDGRDRSTQSNARVISLAG